MPNVIPPLNPPIELRRFSRKSTKPSYLVDYQCNSAFDCPHTVTEFTATHHISSSELSPSAHVLSHNLQTFVKPSSYKEADSIPEWQAAMNKELDALKDTNTWVITPLPHDKKAIKSKWVYKVKYKADGTLERCKGRVVGRY